MENGISIIHTSNIEEEYKRMCKELRIFDYQLYRVFEREPPRQYIKKENSQFEPMPLDPKHQKEIDMIMRQRDKFIKTHYPEFYNK